MSNLLSDLRAVNSVQRKKAIEDTYSKNRRYFKKNHPGIDAVIRQTKSPYRINITEDFLEITDAQQGKVLFSGSDLIAYAEELGDWAHQGWIDLIDPLFRHYPHGGHYSELIEEFRNGLVQIFPEFANRFANKNVNLSEDSSGHRFSNPVVFVGIFHGLHIAHYLSRSKVRTATFIEPEPARFEVSCYFLDYEEIDARFNGLLLHVGEEPPNEFFDVMFLKATITTNIWLRILPNFISEPVKPIIKRLQLRWSVAGDEWVPATQELNGLRSGLKNLQSKQHLLFKAPQLSKGARIAVVGAGPSLTLDIGWLKKNRDKLILFVAHSAIRPLRQHGIKADFQICIDLAMTGETFNALGLDPDIPVIVDNRFKPDSIKLFKKCLLVAGSYLANPVQLDFTLSGIQPTTGNLAIAVACFCSPIELYLLGMDFGFRQKQKSHVSGSAYDDQDGLHEAGAGEEQISVPANFIDAEPLITRGYFNNARVRAEGKLQSTPETKVYNLSDGAFISGAEAKRSDQVSLPDYREKKQDIGRISESFKTMDRGDGWSPFSVSGRNMLALLQQTLIENLTLNEFSWHEFSQKVDLVQLTILRKGLIKSPDDQRMGPFLMIIRDLLRTWYQIIIFSNSSSESECVYQRGFELLREVIQKFEWTEDLEVL